MAAQEERAGHGRSHDHVGVLRQVVPTELHKEISLEAIAVILMATLMAVIIPSSVHGTRAVACVMNLLVALASSQVQVTIQGVVLLLIPRFVLGFLDARRVALLPALGMQLVLNAVI